MCWKKLLHLLETHTHTQVCALAVTQWRRDPLCHHGSGVGKQMKLNSGLLCQLRNGHCLLWNTLHGKRKGAERSENKYIWSKCRSVVKQASSLFKYIPIHVSVLWFRFQTQLCLWVENVKANRDYSHHCSRWLLVRTSLRSTVFYYQYVYMQCRIGQCCCKLPVCLFLSMSTPIIQYMLV